MRVWEWEGVGVGGCGSMRVWEWEGAGRRESFTNFTVLRKSVC